uniref:Uncharacterized protein n=1 Tax=Opuntia streptacantha TaxID=393608 RepID=A0A7C9AGV5_OPUST
MVTDPYISENVSDAEFLLFLLAKMIADTASLEFVARGKAMNEMKNEGIPVASEKLLTESTSGSAKTAVTTVPRTKNNIAFMVVFLGSSISSPVSSPGSPNRKCSCFASSS